MNTLLKFTLTLAAVAALASTSLAGSCGGCASGDKAKDKTEEGAQS